jgi:hypothetical protein
MVAGLAVTASPALYEAGSKGRPLNPGLPEYKVSLVPLMTRLPSALKGHGPEKHSTNLVGSAEVKLGRFTPNSGHKSTSAGMSTLCHQQTWWEVTNNVRSTLMRAPKCTFLLFLLTFSLPTATNG